ncbi:MAG: hypothetical protein MJ016_02235 [Victivallaceae bacterium]|nr:hypothetical protein [Victivallaceae bacterium]
MIDIELNKIAARFDGLIWCKTLFDDVQYYYAAYRLYIVRISIAKDEYVYCFTTASSPTDAITKAVFRTYRSLDEVKKND